MIGLKAFGPYLKADVLCSARRLTGNRLLTHHAKLPPIEATLGHH